MIKVIGKDFIVHYSSSDYCLLTLDHTVYRYTYQSGYLEKVCSLPPANPGLLSYFKDKLARNSFINYIRKPPGLGHLIQDNHGNIIIIYDKIYIFRSSSNVAIARFSNSVNNFLPPLRGGIAVTQSSKVYFGEYTNVNSSSIRIFCIDTQTEMVNVCWTFDVREIKHVHAVVYDKFRNRIWVTTGDSDSESAFFYTDDGFTTLNRFAGGDQSWRAVCLLFDEHGIEWGMDAGKDARASDINKLFRYDFRTNKRTELATIENPAYYAAESSDGSAWLATTFEPGRLQDTPCAAALWFRDTGGNWKLEYEFPYESNPRRGVSKYAQLFLPYGVLPKDTVCLTPINVTHYHYKSLIIK